MVRCNNCMTVFHEDEDMSLLVEHADGSVNHYDRLSTAEGDMFFRGCPLCMTDSYLMDV